MYIRMYKIVYQKAFKEDLYDLSNLRATLTSLTHKLKSIEDQIGSESIGFG